MIESILALLILPTVPGVYQGPACAGHPARPPASYTSALKVQQIHSLGYTDTNPKDYEEDHLVSLSLGGAPRDPNNLWPQPWVQASRDDRIEYSLYLKVCRYRTISTATAVRYERRYKRHHG